MPCTDSSSEITIHLDSEEKFLSFDFVKIACGKKIKAETNYEKYCRGRNLDEILQFPYEDIQKELQQGSEEEQFILYLEWEALRCAIAQYHGIEDIAIDRDRCQITSIKHNDNDISISLIIFPPKDLPNISPCLH